MSVKNYSDNSRKSKENLLPDSVKTWKIQSLNNYTNNFQISNAFFQYYIQDDLANETVTAEDEEYKY